MTIRIEAERRPLMSIESAQSIADDVAPARSTQARIVWALAIGLGAATAIYYAHAGLTLSHYDARAHLVVSRRVLDSLTPGVRQLGAVWLPLPHLLNLVPVQWDWSFRTGFSGIAISIGALACGLAALSHYLARHASSSVAAIALPLVVFANPNVLYLQSTPMTEPILFGLSLVALLAVDTWVATGVDRHARWAGLAMAGLVLTRYEGWLIAGAMALLAWVARPAPRHGWIRLAAYPLAAIAGFLVLSHYSTGALFTTGGFFTPSNPARGSFSAAFALVFSATSQMAGPAVMVMGTAGLAAVALRARGSRGRSLLPLSLLAAGVLPLAAFYSGHPERVRYMVPLAVAAAVLAGVAVATLPRRARPVAAVLLLAASLVARPPLSATAPMVVEAQWEVPLSRARGTVTDYLQAHYDGTPIMANMGSLAHYMQETAAIGLPLRSFLHEGNGDIWSDASEAPRAYVRWMLIEEIARDGDPLALRARQDRTFLQGFSRVAEGGGLALYRRLP